MTPDNVTAKGDDKTLRRQVIHELNSHFLFNALTSIMVEERKDPARARMLTKKFAEYLRFAMSQAQCPGEWIPLSREIKAVDAYLHLQSVRFGGKIKYDIRITDANLLIPAGVLRALAENAVSHGISKKPEGGSVVISQRVSDGGQELLVEDDGLGFDVSLLNGKDSGGISFIKSVADNIEDADFSVDSRLGDGTSAKLNLPIINISEE